MLAYTPFIDPIATIWPGAYSSPWFVNVYCLIVVSLFTSIAYKALRYQDFDGPLATVLAQFAKHTLTMTVQIVLGIWALGLFVWLVVYYIVPHIAPAA